MTNYSNDEEENTDNKKNYSNEIIQVIDVMRNAGHSWEEVAESVNKRFKLKKKAENYRAAYLRSDFKYYNDEEDEDSKKNYFISAKKSQLAAAKARKKLKDALVESVHLEDVLEQTKEMVKRLKKFHVPKTYTKKGQKAKLGKMTVEMLLSDLQLGKRSPDFNLKIAQKRLQKYTESAILKIQQHQQLGYNVEKVVLVLLGDIIESMDKAVQKLDYTSCEIDTPEQIVLSVEYITKFVLIPLAMTGIPLKVICIPGNHDNNGPGMRSYKAGKTQLSYIIYKDLELVCNSLKLNVKFDITEGVFAIHDYYGDIAVYEHGYGISVDRKNLQVRLNDRIRQMQKYCKYFRMGDKHEIIRFGGDTLVINGAFFGCQKFDRGEEFSSVQGFSAQAEQLIFFHVPRKDSRLSIYDSFVIQLGHIK